MDIPTDGPTSASTKQSDTTGPLAGLLSGAVGLAVGELFSAITKTAGPIVVVGNSVVDNVPKPVKKFAVSTFGVNDKRALIIGVLVVIAIYAAFVGRIATKRFALAAVGVGLFAAAGTLAALTGRNPKSSNLIGVFCAFLATIAALSAFSKTWRKAAGPINAKPPSPQDYPTARFDDKAPVQLSRRKFFATSGAAVGTAAVSYGLSKSIRSNSVKTATKVSPGAAKANLSLPQKVSKLARPTSATETGIAGMEPFFTPNDKFYRIDTALEIPQIDVATWRLDVVGMVSRPLTIIYTDLVSGKYGPLIEHDCTMMCVSNEIGGDLIGNARWTGVRLSNVLNAAGIADGADQVFCTSVDGFTAGFPTKVALDGREALLVVGMNGEHLAAKHGYPVRLVVPGIYGYVSAVKWLKEIKLTTFDKDQGYWIPRGWSALGPIKTNSRIDVVGSGGTISKAKAGTVPIGGVAWAQHTGIAKVEVQIDDGAWQTATLAADGGIDTWRQWRLDWDAVAGGHTIRCRATDATGFTQGEQPKSVDPDGAEGWHTVHVTIE